MAGAGPSMGVDAGPGFLRRFWPVWGLGMLGLLGLMLQAPPASLVERSQELQALPPLAQRAVLVLNPLILVTVLAAVGAATAHRVGLGSHAAATGRGPLSPVLAVAAGALLALALSGVDAVLSRHLGAQWQQVKAQADSAPLYPGLAIGVLYGGLAEEVMMRWGLMALVAWLLLRAPRRVPPAPRPSAQLSTRLAWAAITLSAIVFAAAHLPALAQAVDPSAPIVARTLGLNLLAGLVYGWLFWRRSLETAMLAHATTHGGLALLRVLT